MWPRRGWLRELGAGIEARRLTYESEAFLAGQYAQILQTDGHSVPAWAWLSALAHGPHEVLVELAARGRYADANAEDGAWTQVVSGLAIELLAIAARTGCRVEELQHAALVTLESSTDLTGDHPSCSPARFDRAVRDALAHYRDAPH